MLTDPQAYERMMAVAERRATAAQAMQGFGAAAGQYTRTFAENVRYTGAGPGISMGGQNGALMFSERMASKAGQNLDEAARNEQRQAELNQGALKDQVQLRRTQLDIAQTLDTTVHNFRELNKVTASTVSAFDSLLKTGPVPAGGRPTIGGAPTVGAGGISSSALTGKPLTGLDQDFANRFSSAANEYFQATGKQVNVASAFRSYEDQMREYNRYMNQGGLPAAPPGRSKHEIGRAVDVNRDAAAAMEQMGILRKYGLSRPVANDPVHISGAAGFRGMLSGPMSGYRPNVLMHGNEELSIRPMGAGASGGSAAASEGLVRDLIDSVDQLVTLSGRQLQVNERMLKYQQ